MGKYMGRPKAAPSDVAAVESPLGVRTRAKTLALRNKIPDPVINNNNNNNSSGLSYLQLRNRRLEKPSHVSNKDRKRVRKRNNYGNAPVVDQGFDLAENKNEKEEEEEEKGCFGENFGDSEARERSTRESTPISLVRDPEIIRTPGSSTRPTRSDQARIWTHNPILRHIPTAHDMDEFFAGAEVPQQQQFIEKYNFDPVNDMPLPGRYEWVKVEPKS